ncbi:MAG: hypothetical protein OEZ06_30780 [Myxococcales bacterium]|nr:hypothetical protein [Myxococcales bacterium]
MGGTGAGEDGGLDGAVVQDGAAEASTSMSEDAAADARPAPSDADTQPPDAGDRGSCEPGVFAGCANTEAVFCNDQGTGFRNEACGTSGCNMQAQRCNTCLPGSIACGAADTHVVCGQDGLPAATTTCDLGCSDAVTPAACRDCQPGGSTCAASVVTRCDADGFVASTEACASGCDASGVACVPPALVPSNLDADICATATDTDRSFASSTSIDTDSGCDDVISQGGEAPDICVLVYRALGVSAGATVKVRGSRALALVATTVMTIEGTLDASADGDQEGPGASAVADGIGQDGLGEPPNSGASTQTPANAGGGGGGHGSDGGAGGGTVDACADGNPCADPGAPGQAYGSATLSPLHGGAHGGQNSASSSSSRRTTLGGGGGALQLLACGTLTLASTAVLDAGGGGGGGGNSGTAGSSSDTPGGGAGGGSGGALLLEAAQLNVAAGATVVANGGGGGGGATRTPSHISGEPGSDGLRSLEAAPGGVPGGGSSKAGGAGGTGDFAPEDGIDSGSVDEAAGGGGGAAGRIRINTLAGSGQTLTGAIISPAPSFGIVGTQ